MKLVAWRELVELPINSVFFEVDLPTEPLFVKTGNCSGPYKSRDIRIIPLHQDDNGQSRLGLAEMDSSTRESKRWHALTEPEINTLIGRLMLAKPAVLAANRRDNK